MTKPRLASLLLLSTAIATPSIAWAQDSSTPADPATAPESGRTADDQAQAPEVSVPGGAIIVTGRRQRNLQRSAAEVVSVLSTEDIARTGEGDIAGSLSHVTGLSVVGSGYVYVRGLGDRYSLALLNGSPLPSPEPLKRVVPLDLFPTDIIASSLVQKSYSVNFPGEFGGGVINLTTQAIPEESFLKIGGGIGWDTETTNKLSYTYFGSKSDWTGYDYGNRSYPADLKALFDSGQVLVPASDQARAIGSVLFTARNSVVQKDDHTQPNFSADITGGTSFDLGGATLGLIATGGYSNKTQTRSIRQQTSKNTSADPGALYKDFNTVQTDNRVVVNGLLGLGLEWNRNKIRWTNVYIHDTDKNASLSLGHRNGVTTNDILGQRTAWYERQLISSQVVGEFKPEPDTKIDVRAGYANSKRLAPFEINAEYERTNANNDYGSQFINYLGTSQLSDPTTIQFARLNENLWSAGFDVTHQFVPGWSGTVGYAFQDTRRTNFSRQFGVYVNGDPKDIRALGLLRLDVLLQPGTWYLPTIADPGVNYTLRLQDSTASTGFFKSSLLNHAYYGKIDGQVTDSLSIDAGLRWEWSRETTTLMPVGSAFNQTNSLKNQYFLPAGTLTYEIRPGMQFRISGSKTIARPQFRELLTQLFYDPESSRTYQGNPKLKDTQIYNAEARFEWYFRGSQHISLGAFYKHLNHPIESILYGSELFITTYANAPAADLYGAELEVQKDIDLSSMGGAFTSRKLVVTGNYTYTNSKLKVGPGDTIEIGNTSALLPASNAFVDGAPLTGQSDHIANLQFSLEDSDSLSQQTILLNYASKRAVSRGLFNSGQPDVIENPGFTIDVVVRQGFTIAGKQLEVKLEGRNLTGRRHEEYQQLSNGRIEFNTYDLGRVFKASASIRF
ncbi:TonB-dependent receptor plug domain-containing protein [Novosphingobium sp. ZN18A2]|uniref:TonB-dependent receptor domain-containing protein n=1 Tax=Novosphingobium sp. ZN18A2 TaxID=3079861 RepID=UPI0030CDE561